MKRNMKKKQIKTKSFQWTGFIKPINSSRETNYHCYSWGQKGFKMFDVVKDKEVKCQLTDKRFKKCKNCGFERD